MASFVLWGAAAARADDPTYTLPQDGAWARYRGLIERPDTGAQQEFLYTMSIVGTMVENGEVCRWIEQKFEYRVGDDKGTLVDKLLVREKDLLENADPLLACHSSLGT